MDIKIYKTIVKRKLNYFVPRRYSSTTTYQVFVDGKCVYDGMYDRLMTRKELLDWILNKYNVKIDSKTIINDGSISCD